MKKNKYQYTKALRFKTSTNSGGVFIDKEQVTRWKIDKTAIKNAINAGKTVEGATLTNGKRLVIR